MVAEIRNRIRQLLAEKERVLVAIEGSCTSGKSTLAEKLGREFACNVFHMDEFFLRPEQRSEARLAQPGGNVDYERFFEELLLPLLAGKPFSYRPFDCGTMALSEPVAVEPGRLTIVEGVYAMHPRFGEVYDLKIFLTVTEDTRRERILRRPAFLHKRFFEQWIPMEQQYFGTFSIPAQCHLIMDATKAEEAELEGILRAHAAHYPKMAPTDAVKLLYQNEFGGGHLIPDEKACLSYLRREYESVEQVPGAPLTEDIGNGILRVNLNALDEQRISPENLGRAFVRSAPRHRGELSMFLYKLDILRRLTGEGIFAFSPAELEVYLKEYEKAGFPPVSHSEGYREAYHPAYRVVLASLVNV